MKTVETILYQLTDTKAIMGELKETLLKLDACYPEEEAKFLAASAVLEKEVGNTINPTSMEYLAAMAQKVSSDLIYMGWQGFRFNQDCFTNPANALLLEEDFESIHRERNAAMLPVSQQAQRTIRAFYAALPEKKQELTSDIVSYYAYLQTVGYKIAHYFGFLLANRFLSFVTPGYTSNPAATSRYTRKIQDYLHMDTRLIN